MAGSLALGGLVRFGDFELDPKTGELRNAGHTVRLQDEPLQLLILLLSRQRSELVTREEIQEQIWGPSRFLGFEDSLNQAIRKLREALQDSASNPRFLQTIPRRGYRFLVPVQGSVPADRTSFEVVTVGRQRELTELRTAFSAACQRSGRLICVSGEPGIGKTTLVERFLAGIARETPCHVARGRCSERLAGVEAYLPVLEALESLVRGPGASAVKRILAEVAPGWHTDATGATQERRKREFVSLLEALSREQPLVFFLDDLHWADPSTTDLLSYALPRCALLPVLIVVTYRASDLLLARHPFQEVRLELRTRRLCTELELGSLGLEDIESYIDLQFPGNQFPADFAAAVLRRTEGSPLFLVDLLHDLHSVKLISDESGCWKLTRPVEEIENTLPDSMRSMVARKIGKLSDSHRELLETAAIQGAEFDSAVLATVLKWPAREVEESLRRLEQAHRLVRFIEQHDLPESAVTLRYSFAHALYQQALYADVAPSFRAEVSGDTAAALLELHEPTSRDIAAQVAQLFETARHWSAASKWFCIAAANSARNSAYREAAEVARRAVAVAGRLDGQARDRHLVEAATQLARARQGLSDFEQSIADFTLAAEAAARLGDAAAQVDALCSAAFGAGPLRRIGEMRRRAQEAFAVAEAAGVSTAQAEGVLGYERIIAGDLTTAHAHLHRARPALMRQGAFSQAAFVTGSVAFLHGLQSEYDKAEALLAEAMGEQMRLASSSADLLRVTWMRGMAMANQGRISEALELLEAGMRMGDLNGEQYWSSRIPNTIGWIYSELLDHETALKYNLAGVEAGRQAEIPEAEANSHLNLSRTYTALGDRPAALRHLFEAERILSRQDGFFKWRFAIRLAIEKAWYWLAAGDLAKAHDAAEAALSRAEAALARKHAASAHKLLGDIARLEDKPDRAAEEYTAALEILRRYPCPLIQWRILAAANLHEDAASTIAALASTVRDSGLRERLMRSTCGPAVAARPAGSVSAG